MSVLCTKRYFHFEQGRTRAEKFTSRQSTRVPRTFSANVYDLISEIYERARKTRRATLKVLRCALSLKVVHRIIKLIHDRGPFNVPRPSAARDESNTARML